MMNLGYDSQAFEGWLNAPTYPMRRCHSLTGVQHLRITHQEGLVNYPGHFPMHRTLYIVP